MVNLLRLAFPTSAAVLLAACGATPEEHLNQGQAAYAQHRFAEANKELASVLADEPGNLVAMEALVRTFIAMEDPIAARGMLERMERHGGAPRDAAVLMGEIDLLQDQYEAALSAVEAQSTAEAWRVKALAHIGLADRDKAHAAFRRGEASKGDKGPLLADYARFMLARGDIAAAEALGLRAARQSPVSHDGLIVNAGIALARARPARALEWFDKTLKAYPESRQAMIGKVGVLAALGREAEAEKLLKQVKAQNGGHREVVYLESLILAREGEWEKARGKLQAIERELHDWPDAEALYAETRLRLGQTEQARLQLTSLMLRLPQDRNVRRLLAEAMLEQGEADNALETLAPLLELEDTTQQELAVIARAEEAAGISERSVVLDPEKDQQVSPG